MRNRLLLVVTIGVTLLVLLGAPVLASSSTVQIPASGWDYLGGKDSPATWSRLGQRLTLNDGEIFAVGYQLRKEGEPTGTITLSVRRASTDVVLWSGVWGSAGNLSGGSNGGYIQLDITPPLKVSSDIRICVEYNGGNETDYVQAGYYSGDKITGQWYTNFSNYSTDVDGWHDIGEAEEAAYYMLYVGEGVDPTDSGDDSAGGISWWITGAILGIVMTVAIGLLFLMKPKGGQNERA